MAEWEGEDVEHPLDLEQARDYEDQAARTRSIVARAALRSIQRGEGDSALIAFETLFQEWFKAPGQVDLSCLGQK